MQTINLFYDVETTAPNPTNGELIEICMIATDKDYNELGYIHEKCSLAHGRYVNNVWGKEENLWPDPTGSSDPRKRNATDIHGITWEEAKDFQKPVEMYRKLWTFLNQFDDYSFNLVFHSNTRFDLRWLLYRSNLHAEPLYKYLLKKTSVMDINENGEREDSTRYDDTMKMAQTYIRKGTDILKKSEKLQKTIDKMNGHINKDRKTPVKTDKLNEWITKRDEAQKALESLETSSVQLKGYSLDKICDSLGIELDHHKADSDTKALIPIHKFLTTNLH